MNDNSTLLEQAQAVLSSNDHGRYTIPALRMYPHQWLWDSCFVAIGLRHLDIERAKEELVSLLRGQWRNGMLPNMIFTPRRGHKFHEDAWQSWLSPLSPDDVSTSGITQPPMLAEAVVQIGEKLPLTERRKWYALLWPHLLAYHEWLYAERDPHGEGLVLQIHPWETGMDNTPPWMQDLNQHLRPWWLRVLKNTHIDSLLSLVRTDTRLVPALQRSSNIEELIHYAAFLRLRRKLYDINKILDYGLFSIEDLGFNCILLRANTHLSHIARFLRLELPKELVERMDLAQKALEQLWDPHSKQYYSRDFVSQRLLKEPTIATLLPLYAGVISKERAQVLVGLLEDEQLFGTAYPIPSVPSSSTWFNPLCYWQGPSWVNINWLVIDGLRRYGFTTHAEALKESTLEMITKSGMYEYFNPLSGEGLGAHDFSWTAALAIDLLKA